MVGLSKLPCEEAMAAGMREERCAKQRQSWVLTATILGSSMAFIDGSVVGVAMPVMQRALSASATQIEWVNNAYLLLLGSLVLLGGSLGDRLGRKKIFVIGVVIFTCASVLCGLCPNVSVLILFRAIQGIGAALLVPTSLAILGATFSSEDRGKAIGTWAAASAIVAALAPLLGGVIVDSLSWRAIFAINVPVGAAAILISLWQMPETKDPDADGRLDLLGAGLGVFALSGVAYGLSTDPLHQECLTGGVLLFGLFLLREARAKSPLVPFSIFRNRTFSGTNLITLFLYFAISGALFFLPFFLIQVKGFTASAAGAAFLPFTVLMGGFSRWAGGLVDRFGARPPLIVGPLVAGSGYAVLAFVTPQSSYWGSILPGIGLIGAGMAISVAPLTTAVMSSAPAANVGIASGINNAVARIAGLLAVAVLGALVLRVFSAHLESWLTTQNSTVVQAVRPQLSNLAAISLPAGLPGAEAARTAIQDSFTAALRAAFLACAACAVTSAFCAAFMLKGKSSR